MRRFTRWIHRLPPLLGALLLVSTAHATTAILRKAPGAWVYGPETVYSSGSTTTTLFFPLSEPMPLGEMSNARFAYQITQDVGICKLRGAVRFSNDGINWETDGQVSSTYVVNDADIVWVPNVDLTNVAGTTPATYIQFGVQTLNESGATIAMCRATLRVEPRTN